MNPLGLFYMYGIVSADKTWPDQEPSVIVHSVMDEIQKMGEMTELNRFGEFLIHNGALEYRKRTVIDRFRFEFSAYDNVSKNKFKLLYPHRHDIEKVVAAIGGMRLNMQFDYPRFSENLARVAIIYERKATEYGYYHIRQHRFENSPGKFV